MSLPGHLVRHGVRFFSLVVISLFLLFETETVYAQGLELDVTGMSIEELVQIDVISVSKKGESLQDVPAAVFILTQEDLRRSGVTNIPDALRQVPGVQVARIDANKWAVSMRGFNSRTANKLLVLIDGRSIYNPLFSGVLWESKDVFLQDVDRIEVIRGPGGSLWGTNAINGIINIITKTAHETTGGLVEVGLGTEERGLAALRYGLKLDRDAHVRVYGRYVHRDEGFAPAGAFDDSKSARLGFRMDGKLGGGHELTVQGDMYDVHAGEFFPPDASQEVEHRGGNVLLRWRHASERGSGTALQFYYDQTRLDNVALGELRNTIDLDFQHSMKILKRHDMVWGLGYRLSADEITNSQFLQLFPAEKKDHLFSAFLQNNLTLLYEALGVTFGAKFEHNDYTGLEVQPNLRLTWTPSGRHTVWASVSRAVRIPSRLEADFLFNGDLIGSEFDSEILNATEVGFRLQPSDGLLLDWALFRNAYDRLLSIEDATFQNELSGKTYGVEGSAKWQIAPWWQVAATYTYLHMNLRVGPTSIDTLRAAALEGSDPRHQATVSASLRPFSRWSIHIIARHIDELPALNVAAYVTADIHVAWKPVEFLEMALSARNLFDAHHFEQLGAATTGVERCLTGKLSVRF